LILSLIINFLYPSIRDAAAEEMPLRRFAFIVGANDGGPGRTQLRYAVKDARALSSVLTEMGGVLPEDTVFLTDPSREIFFKELNKLVATVAGIRDKSSRVEVIFYYSGHSDEDYMMIGRERISYQEFRNKINSINADVRIAILDSCASGSFNLLKGVKKRSPFLINKAYDMKGFAFMTSSSSLEPSQESGRLKGSIFTHYLVSGLRGAADMSQDGIITLNEAYQYAYRETLTLSQKTMSGPQHPSYNIQMSGKGDVIMTDVRKSSAVLVIDKSVFGRIFIHNQDNVLVVEINKPYGRDLEIGLEPGKYRIINISEGNIFESKFTMRQGKSYNIKKSHFTTSEKIETQARGMIPSRFLPHKPITKRKRFSLEIFSGFSQIDGDDINKRVQREAAAEKFYYDDMFVFYSSNGAFTHTSKTHTGKYKQIKSAVPFGFRVKYHLNRTLALSLGFEYASREYELYIHGQYSMTTPQNEIYLINRDFSPFTHSVKGYAPTLGIHLTKKISTKTEIEAFVAAGPLFAECMYALTFHETSNSENKIIQDDFLTEYSRIKEEGSGTGIALNGGIQLNYHITPSIGLFVGGGYNYWKVESLSGPGKSIQNSETKTWNSDWVIKRNMEKDEWGVFESIWPSNYPGDPQYEVLRDFQLNLSGFTIKAGAFIRF
jgi:hypothetical protein